MKFSVSVACAVVSVVAVVAFGKPLSPAEALASFRLESEDLRVSLVAAEPEVVDPVAACFDEAGRLYVVESRGYPHPGKGLPDEKKGVVARLLDADGDGRFEKRTVFAAGFVFPNGILRYGTGFFVTDAPNVWWLEDADGDGKAEKREVVLTGFSTTSSSEQLRVASPTLGPDGWVYLTSGLTGGSVISPRHPERPAVSAKKNDWRFHPKTLEVEALTGSGQVGQAFDHEGRRFVCDNRRPLSWVVFPPGVLERNPNLLGASAVMDLADPGMATPLFPLSPDTTAASFIPKLMHKPHAGSFTSSCGLCFYSGTALPKHRGAFFICEPAQNLVHCRFTVETADAFTSRPSSEGREFLASPDQWFRPVFAFNGPDGALYLCDMYRKYVDHPNYLPEEAAAKMDFEAGKRRGRIWKVISTKGKDEALAARLPKARGVTLAIRQALAAKGDIATLARLAEKAGGNRWFRAAAFSSCRGKAKALLEKTSVEAMPVVIEEAALLAAKEEPAGSLYEVVSEVLKKRKGWSFSQRFAFLLGFPESLRKPYLDELVPIARKRVVYPAGPLGERLLAARFLPKNKSNGALLLKLVQSGQESVLLDSALRGVAETDDADLGKKLLGLWPGLDVPGRVALVEAVTSRRAFHSLVLDAIDAGDLPLHAVPLHFRNRFTSNPAVKERASALFEASENSDRMKVYRAHKAVLTLPADSAEGKPTYQRLCASCHRFGELGHEVGPDLSGYRNQPADALLLHLLVPNREVFPNYALYVAETKTGASHAGILAEKTGHAVTLVLPLGQRVTLRRSELKSLRASSVSLMPDGLENGMTRQELANLLAFLKQ